MSNITRRKLLLGGAAAATAGSLVALRPGDIGRDHAPYYQRVSDALDKARLSQPMLVVDRQLFKKNLSTLRKNIGGRFDYRVIGKSLPSVPMLQLAMNEAQTDRVMLFNQPFLTQVAQQLPKADVLMGKPTPVVAAENFYRENRGSGFDPGTQLQWLIDSPERLQQYRDLASQLGVNMRLNIELDIGLHRGGARTEHGLKAMLDVIEGAPNLTFSGFMGYEAHIMKAPGGKEALRDEAMKRYASYTALAQQVLQRPLDGLVLNSSGSQTYQMYSQGDFPFNELCAGSCLVKPTDFDLPTLTDHQPAAFIATPVLKALDETEIPGVDWLGGMMARWNPNRAKTFFTYGGYWKAIPESPAGLSINTLFGRSTNQEMHNGSNSVHLKQDDWVFLRPTQSEFVFLQFGDIAVYEEGEIVDMWPVFTS